MAKAPSPPPPPPPPRPPAPVPVPPAPPAPQPSGTGPGPTANPSGKTGNQPGPSPVSPAALAATNKQIEAQNKLITSIGQVGKHFGMLGGFLSNILGLAVKGGAGGDTASLRSLGKAAGTVGLALDVGEMAGSLATAPIKMFSKAVDTAGQAASKLAGNDGLGALTTVADGVADTLGGIPIAGQFFQASIKAVTGGLNMFKSVIDSFAGRAKELSGLNPLLAQAVAETEVQKFFADMREANANQEEYRDLIYAQAKLDRQWQDAITDIKKQLVPYLVKGATFMTGLVKILPAMLKKLVEILSLLPGVGDAFKLGKAMVDQIVEVTELLEKIKDNTKKEFEDTAGIAAILQIGREGAKIPNFAPFKQQRAVVPPVVGVAAQPANL